ncbi:unnamed protein product [Brachionus calyciflorus]|uniref:Uncharacterized protein n=1 Tax=Brachionus calyciflorus TaxID=104777 RepID=A0A813YCQ8_9BILA|nr:unnamed protein product [Brachionus calyciflorus]
MSTTKWPSIIVTFSTEVEEENSGEQIGILIGIFAASFVGVFIILGACVLSHVIYMRVFKRKYKEPLSKSIWFIELDKPEKKKQPVSQSKWNFFEGDSETNSDVVSLDKVQLKEEIQKKKEFEILNTKQLDNKNMPILNKYVNPNCIITQV